MQDAFLPQKSVLVVGDVMLDRYWSGQTHRISPEAPVPIVHVEDSDDRPGGAANVALNLAALGMHVRLAGLIGDDDAGVQLGANLEASGVNASLVRTTHPTITKLRVMSRHQQLIRLDNEQRFRHSDSAQLLAQAGDQLDGIDALVISDYAKGSLTAVLPTLVQEARRREIPVLIDPKGQDFGPYRGATLLTPNRGEFERIAGQFEDEAQRAAAAENLIAQLSLEALLLTRSEEGMSLYRPGHAPLHLPAQQHEVFDVTGAGDTVIATLAAFIANGEALESAASAANTAGGLAVAKLGAANVARIELQQALNATSARDTQGKCVADADALLPVVNALKTRGNRIVFTNGCFDILHAGHVRYLQEARALGDQLVVAVNSDESVRGLKGDSRPINSLGARMEVLAALGCVDWVVPFDAQTPAALIDAIVPNVLVKGGDWPVEQIVGHGTVVASGGAVHSLPFAEGYSTTATIEKISRLTSG